MEMVKQVRENEDEGLLGFIISSSMEGDEYETVGKSVLRTFEKYPEHAEILQEMLIAISGWKLESLIEDMEDERDYYEGL